MTSRKGGDVAGGHLIKVGLIVSTLVSCADAGSPRGAAGDGARPAQQPVAATAECVGGWEEPPAGDVLHDVPLETIADTMGIAPAFEVAEMRYFVGPESPPVDKGYLQDIERWYVEATHASGLRGRWLVERRRFGAGVVAVAPWGTEGFRSPDWVGFQYDSSYETRRRYEALPGRWAGIPYDFVVGGSGLDNPGLPTELTGCLADT